MLGKTGNFKLSKQNIRFKGTPEGDGNFLEDFFSHLIPILDMKIPRKGTETSLYIFLNVYLLYIRYKSTPKGDGNLYMFISCVHIELKIRFKGTPKGDGNEFIYLFECLSPIH